MRLHTSIGIVVTAWASIATATAGAQSADSLRETPRQLIKDVVYNELHDHESHEYWEYLIEKQVGSVRLTEKQIETPDGPIQRLVAVDGVQLNMQQRQQEDARLNRLLHNPSEQAKVKEKYEEDERRIGRIMNLLPDAFLYQFEGIEGDDIRMSFRPNAEFHPPTIEARVFHAMGGTIWINAREKRLSRLSGHLLDDLVFGCGLLGRLNKGGWFNLERVQVSPGSWKTHVLDVEMTGKAILFKTISKNTHEVRRRFVRISRDTTAAQATRLLAQAPGAS